MNLLAEFQPFGRLNRRDFLLRLLLGIPVGLFLCASFADEFGHGLDLLPAIGLTVYLVSVWSRRLHDRGRSAWWLLLAAIPVAGPLILLADCAFGRSTISDRYGPVVVARADYLTVRS